MSELKSFSDLVYEIKEKKVIKSFEELKVHLSNEVLIPYQFDLPREFNLVDNLTLPRNHRFMRNFSKTLSFSKSFDSIKKDLSVYFKYNAEKIPNNLVKRDFSLIKNTYSFKQVFFDIDPNSSSKVIMDDISNFNLETASLDSLKDAITEVEQPKAKPERKESDLSNESFEIRSDNKVLTENINTSNFTPTFVVESELDNLMKNFKIEQLKQPPIEDEDDIGDSKDELLDETFKLLGLGSIKKNLGKTIITKKKKEGLLFDEWVKENLEWARFLIKKLVHIDYLSLKDEYYYLGIVRNYPFPEEITNMLDKLFKSLHIDQNN